MPSLIERPQWYVQNFSNAALAAGAQQLGVGLSMDTDAPFRLTGVAVYCYSEASDPLGSQGNVGQQLRFTRADGTWMSRRIISAQQINPYDAGAQSGAAGANGPFFFYFSPIHSNVLYPAGSVINIDQQAIAGNADALVVVVFIGTKMFQPGAVWSPTYPPGKYRARPFFGYNLQIPLANIPVLNVPVPSPTAMQQIPNSDADFVWQCGTQSDYRPNFHGLGIKIKDWTGKYYMNDYVPLELIFGFDNAQGPGLVYPEIYIPRSQSLYVDVKSML